MKKMTMLIAVLATFVIASCGGSSDTTPTPTPTITTTNDSTKAVSRATIAATNEAVFNAGGSGLQDLEPTTSVSQSTTGKETSSTPVDYIHYCTVSGTVSATGTMTASCDGSGDTWSCTSIALDLALQFNDCTESVTVDSAEYTVALNGDGTAAMSGSASSINDSTNVYILGTAAGTLTATGDANGTVTLNLGVDISGSVDPEPTVTCSGTASVVTDAVTEVCGITSDCSGCET